MNSDLSRPVIEPWLMVYLIIHDWMNQTLFVGYLLCKIGIHSDLDICLNPILCVSYFKERFEALSVFEQWFKQTLFVSSFNKCILKSK